MRTLTPRDIFPMAKILKKMDIKDSIIELFKSSKDKLTGEIFIDFVFILLEKMEPVQNELYSFIGSLCEKTGEEVGNMPLDEFISILQQIFGDKNFGSFLKLAAK